MSNPEIPSFHQPEETSPEIISALIDRLNENTEYLSTIDAMVNLPEFQEMMALGEDTFQHILDDKDNFSHWHNVMTQFIARDIGEPIEFPEEIRTKVKPAFDHVIAWLENRQQSNKLPESS
jgi:HD-GYP domain-containing protein (c-di-GMP phosphodiesterase class II)